MSKKNEDKQIPLRLSEYLKYISEYDFIKDIDDKLGDKSLFDYQLNAVKNALKVLRLYQSSDEYSFYESIYKNYDIDKSDINKASFWMATGSGKTIVMVKLIKEIYQAIKDGFIKDKPILILAPTDIILNQIKKELLLNGLDPKELDEKNLATPSLFKNDVFLFRSDLLDDGENISKSKDGKRKDYNDFLQDDGWYIFLDEAHRGDNNDSKRKAYIKELGNGFKEKGFIFNFSATFTDDVDKLTCAYDYNLSKFNSSGYGKEIVLFDNELKIDEDSEEELRIEQVLKSFLVFSLVKKSKELIVDKTLAYHNPLMIVVSDKVNTSDAGIKIYFKAVKKIIENSFDLYALKERLKLELQGLKTQFSNYTLNSVFIDLINEINENDMKKYVFHDGLVNGLEACKISKNQKEIVVKSKNSSKPFLLINIGDNKEWKDFLCDDLGVEVGNELSDGYFDKINEDTSPINIMLGSKVFSEGWDSNRVNEILFLNIGSKNAIKYVTQTIGRGVRIEPKKGGKKRKGNTGIETLFVMASDSDGVKQILSGFKAMQGNAKALVGFQKTNAYKEPKIPVYANLDTRVKLKLSNSDLDNLRKYVNNFDDDVLYFYDDLCDELGVKIIDEIKDDSKSSLFEKGVNTDYFQNNNISVKKIYQTIKSKAKKLEGFKVIDDEIKHFNEFSTTLSEESVKNINAKIKEVLKNVNKNKKLLEKHKNIEKAYSDEELLEMFASGKIDGKKMLELKNNANLINEVKVILIDEVTENGYKISAKLQSHYYLPMIKKENDDKINYCISVESEIEFLNDLENNLKNNFADCKTLKNSEWGFSRIVENVDDIYIPYFDTQSQIYRKFYPDFIFWLKDKASGIESIYFIDPKGLAHQQNARDKIEGFESIFSKNGAIHNGIKVYLYYYNNKNPLPSYKDYVKGRVEDIFDK